jgi:hypothetical protein
VYEWLESLLPLGPWERYMEMERGIAGAGR